MSLLLWDRAVLLDLGKSLLEFLDLSAGLFLIMVKVILSGVVRHWSMMHWSVVSCCWGVVWSIVVRCLVVEVMLVMGFLMDRYLMDWGVMRVVVDWLVGNHVFVALNWLSVLCGWVEDVIVVMSLHFILFLELSGEGVLLVVHVLLLNVMLLLHFEFGDAFSGFLQLPLNMLLSLKDFLLMMELLREIVLLVMLFIFKFVMLAGLMLVHMNLLCGKIVLDLGFVVQVWGVSLVTDDLGNWSVIELCVFSVVDTTVMVDAVELNWRFDMNWNLMLDVLDMLDVVWSVMR
jgi:hypothetical protein